jgi:hypothetical protein
VLETQIENNVSVVLPPRQVIVCLKDTTVKTIFWKSGRLLKNIPDYANVLINGDLTNIRNKKN